MSGIRAWTADRRRLGGFAGAIAVAATGIVSCSSPHSTPPSDVVLIARFSDELPANTVDPAFSQVHPTDLAVESRAVACRAWGLTPVRLGGQQVEVHLRVPASQAEHASDLLRQRPGVTVRSATLDALNTVPAPLSEFLPCLTRAKR